MSATDRTYENGLYWESACHFFRNSGLSNSAGSYFVHNKDDNTVKIGLMWQTKIEGDLDALDVANEDKLATIPRSFGESAFKNVSNYLIEDAPYFFLISPDIRRPYFDPRLPQILFVQPMIEFTFSDETPDGGISYSQDSIIEQQGAVMLQNSLAVPQSRPLDQYPAALMSFSDISESWFPVEKDARFVERIGNAIEALAEFPDGKLTVARAFEHDVTAKNNDSFKLYELHARMNGEYACSHFVCINPGTFSLGCSPENVFLIDRGSLTIDVLAATCKASDSEEYLRDELLNSPKQVKEHMSSLNNRIVRYRSICEPDSVRVVKEMEIKRLRNVCHLRSVIVGELLPHLTMFDLFEDMFPLLGARPRDLLPLADSETTPHRYYGGIVGLARGDSGACFLNLRNALVTENMIHAKVGVGIIAESESTNELLETRDKISGLMEAVYLWEQSS